MARRKKPGSIQKAADKALALEKVDHILKHIKAGMMMTVGKDKQFHSRPMMHQQFDQENHELWFFTGKTTGKTEEIETDSRVNISFSSWETNTYLSLCGDAEIVEDPEKEKELWNPLLKAWFPEGLDDPRLVLIRVKIHSFEYWDNTSSALVLLVGFAKAVLTGKIYQSSKAENHRVYLN